MSDSANTFTSLRALFKEAPKKQVSLSDKFKALYRKVKK